MWVNTCLSVHAVYRVPHQFIHDGGKQEATNVTKREDVLGNGVKGFAKITCPSQNKLASSCCLHWFKPNKQSVNKYYIELTFFFAK